MEYGKYEISVSIGFVHDRTDEYDVTDEYTEEEWYEMSEERREEVVHEATMDILSQYVEYGYRFKG